MAFQIGGNTDKLNHLLPGKGKLHPPMFGGNVLVWVSDSERKGTLRYQVGAGSVALYCKDDRPFGIQAPIKGCLSSVLSEPVSRLTMERDESSGLWFARDPEDRVALYRPSPFEELVDLVANKIALHQGVVFPEHIEA